MFYIDPDDLPSPAECEPPSPEAVARAIASQGPAPVSAADFGPVGDVDECF